MALSEALSLSAWVRSQFVYHANYDREVAYVLPVGVGCLDIELFREASAAFRKADINNNGSVDYNEWKTVMNHLGLEINDAVGQPFFTNLDTDKSGALSEREFCEYYVSTKKRDPNFGQQLGYGAPGQQPSGLPPALRPSPGLDDGEAKRKKDVLKNLNFYCLDNSIRESTVGQLRGHTLRNKVDIYREVKKCGLTDIIVASFAHTPRIDDEFCQWLREQNEDFSRLFSFSEVTDGIDPKTKLYDTEKIPVSMLKNQKYGLYNTFFELDLCDQNWGWGEKFTIQDFCKLVEKRMNWVYDNIHRNARILVNLRDLAETIYVHPERVFEFVAFLAKMPKEKRMYCLAFEDPLGEFLPEDVASWSSALRKTMDSNGWQDGHLICHIHEKWGLQNASQIAALGSGCNGVWASLCEEGAALGHACSSVTITNLVRLGNTSVLRNYNCKLMRKAADFVTQVTTNKPPHPKQPVYGERATDLVFGLLGTGSFDLASFFGEKRPIRITALASKEMIRDHLISYFGEYSGFTDEICQQMKLMIETDLSNKRKEEYQSAVGIAVLFRRCGGKLTEKMLKKITKCNDRNLHHIDLKNQVKKIWDKWDVEGNRPDDDSLEFDYFYHAFAATYLGCYHCPKTKELFSSLDVDGNGLVSWLEFEVYLDWALRQYPDIPDIESLLNTAFQKGLLPDMAAKKAFEENNTQ